MRLSKSVLSSLSEEFRFLKGWLGNPLATGAIRPSSPALAKAMASCVPLDRPGPVLELGPGTGSVTEALLKHGVAPADLIAIEYSDEFSEHLKQSYPGVTVHTGDAYALDKLLNHGSRLQFRAIVSSLPLLNKRPEDRRELLHSALTYLAPNAPFIQFSYGPQAPIRENPELYSVTNSKWIMKNVPPARVWTYKKASN